MSAIFEFSSGILIVVVGLAVTHLLGGLGAIIRYRRQIEIDGLPICWMLLLLLVLVGWFYAIWDMLHETEVLGYGEFLVFFLTSTLFYLAARLVTPDVSRDVRVDLTQAFYETKTAFFLCSAAGYLVINVYVLSVQGVAATLGTVDGALGVLLFALACVGGYLEQKRLHWALLATWATIYLTQQMLQSALA